ncbi:MAG: chemotaxis protein CheA [Pseudomonadota bacterium]
MDDQELDELKSIFLDECSENVDILEQGLLQLGRGDNDLELLNEVFRAAHSIKGGGATFGFAAMAELTHHMETLLDEMRSEKRPVLDADLELLLESVDIVRELMESRGDADHKERVPMQERLESAVAGSAASVPAAADPTPGAPAAASGEAAAAEPAAASGWHIRFVPKPELMSRGNDPLLLLRELKRLGALELTPELDSLSSWDAMDPKACYLSWTARLISDCPESAVTEIFEWVEFDCEVTVTGLDEPGTEPSAAAAATAEEPQPVPDAEPQGSAQEPPPAPAPVPAPAAETAPAAGPGSTQDGTVKAVGSSRRDKAASSDASSVRISTEKIDQLINLVGELVITQSMLNRLGASEDSLDIEQLRDRLADLEHNTRELQESVMRVRMLPLSSGFNRLPRLVRDLSRKLDKRVELVVEGGETEIDKTVLERIMDPLVHLVRNSLDHGLEGAEERLAAGKPETGVLKLLAYHQSGSVVIEIKDDGRGINREVVLRKAIERGVVGADEQLSDDQINRLIFAPGFSTASEVSDVSGRGVGMDVVRKNILDLGGHVDLESEPGSGTNVIIRLPLTLAILHGQLVTVCEHTFVIPLLSIIETIEITNCNLTRLPNGTEVFEFRDQYLPLIDLASRFDIAADHRGELIVIIENHGQLAGLVIDQVEGQQQAVIKALDENYRAVPGIAGATIMSTGNVALILDPPAFTQGSNPFSAKDLALSA